MNPETATPEARLRRLKIRGWRRGTKEMDMILGPYADALLEGRERPGPLPLGLARARGAGRA